MASAPTQPGNPPAPTQPAPAPTQPGNPPAPAPTQPAPAPTQPAPAPTQPAQPPTGFGGQQLQRPNTGFGGTDPTSGTPPAAVDPASYTAFTLPESADLSNEHTTAALNAFKAEAGKRGLTQAQAQATLDIMQAMDGHAEKEAETRAAEQSEAWAKEAQMKGLYTQEALMQANQGLMTLDPKGELRQLLNDHGLVNHPALIQVFGAFAKGGGRPAALTGGLSGQTAHTGPVDLATALGYRNA